MNGNSNIPLIDTEEKIPAADMARYRAYMEAYMKTTGNIVISDGNGSAWDNAGRGDE